MGVSNVDRGLDSKVWTGSMMKEEGVGVSKRVILL